MFVVQAKADHEYCDAYFGISHAKNMEYRVGKAASDHTGDFAC